MGEEQAGLVHPDDAARVAQEWRVSLAARGPLRTEARLRRADGAYRWHAIQRVPLRDAAGKVIRWYGIGYDIEDQKRAETALQAKEVDTPKDHRHDSHDGIGLPVRTDTATSSAIAGSTMRVSQRTKPRVSGWGAAINPDDANGLAEYWRSCLASGTPVTRKRACAVSTAYIAGSCFEPTHCATSSGNIIKWYGTNVDIEDRKRADEDLRRSEAFLAKGQELSLTGTFSWHSVTGEFIWSEQLYRIYEFEPGTRITFELIRTRYHPEDKHVIESVAEQARAGVTDFDYEHRLLMPDGSIKYLHLLAHSTPDQEGKGLEYFGAVQDVTQRRIAEDSLDKIRSELAHVTRVMSLGALTASIAHEVNQPLAGIVTNAGTCLRMLAAEPPDVEGARETARRTIRDGNRAADVITRLRALFSKKAGRDRNRGAERRDARSARAGVR